MEYTNEFRLKWLEDAVTPGMGAEIEEICPYLIKITLLQGNEFTGKTLAEAIDAAIRHHESKAIQEAAG